MDKPKETLYLYTPNNTHLGRQDFQGKMTSCEFKNSDRKSYSMPKQCMQFVTGRATRVSMGEYHLKQFMVTSTPSMQCDFNRHWNNNLRVKIINTGIDHRGNAGRSDTYICQETYAQSWYIYFEAEFSLG